MRGNYQVFIGEYAANEGSPTNDMNSALGDASWLLGLEQNSDLVTMSSYAPLWVNVNGYQWTPDLIGYNNITAYGSPSYYAQVMLANNHGTTIVSDTVSGAPRPSCVDNQDRWNLLPHGHQHDWHAKLRYHRPDRYDFGRVNRQCDQPCRVFKYCHKLHHKPDKYHPRDHDRFGSEQQLHIHVRWIFSYGS